MISVVEYQFWEYKIRMIFYLKVTGFKVNSEEFLNRDNADVTKMASHSTGLLSSDWLKKKFRWSIFRCTDAHLYALRAYFL